MSNSSVSNFFSTHVIKPQDVTFKNCSADNFISNNPEEAGKRLCFTTTPVVNNNIPIYDGVNGDITNDTNLTWDPSFKTVGAKGILFNSIPSADGILYNDVDDEILIVKNNSLSAKFENTITDLSNKIVKCANIAVTSNICASEEPDSEFSLKLIGGDGTINNSNIHVNSHTNFLNPGDITLSLRDDSSGQARYYLIYEGSTLISTDYQGSTVYSYGGSNSKCTLGNIADPSTGINLLNTTIYNQVNGDTITAVEIDGMTFAPNKKINFSSPVGGLSFNGTNYLKNYVVDSWTPVMSDLSGNDVPSYNSRSGQYTVIGNRVHFNLYINASSIAGLTAGDDIKISLPSSYLPNNAVGIVFPITIDAGVTFQVGDLYAQATTGSYQYIQISVVQVAGAIRNLKWSDVTSTPFALSINGTYQIDV